MRSILFIYTCFALYVYFRADSMIFLPPPPSYRDNRAILKLPISDTKAISALYLPNESATYTLLYIHGNAEDLGTIKPQLERFHQWGYSVFAYDYRGYGTSEGKPGEKQAYQDAETAYQYLTQQLEISPERIIIYGRSVGGGSAVDLATRHSVAGLALESTFISAFRVVVPIPILPFDKFQNLSKLKKVTCPVLVLHGQADSIIPIKHGQALFDAAPEPKLSLWVPRAGHNDFSAVAGDRHRRILADFQNLIEQH